MLLAEARDVQSITAVKRHGTWARLRRQRVAMACVVIIVLFVLAAILAPLFAPHDANFGYTDGLTMDGRPLGSSAKFLLGTDTTGRDVLSRLLFGARISLTVGVLATLLQISLGVVLGAVSGYYGGWLEAIITRAVDIMLAFPVVLLGLTAASVFSPSVPSTILVIAATQWMYMARVVYSIVLSLKEWQFVEAARAVGSSDRRIVWRHILPHLGPVVIAYSTLGIGVSILLEATLSYLNAGVPTPTASWGAMINGGLTYYRQDPALVLYPGLCLTVVVLSFTLLGDGLTKALQARS
ncbi:MAG: binding-protein-dependent transport system inner rane component [Chloroflexi bacterium]|nr:binding-protein-dependent transport system inner rane component [Chloroflexota bacterium]